MRISFFVLVSVTHGHTGASGVSSLELINFIKLRVGEQVGAENQGWEERHFVPPALRQVDVQFVFIDKPYQFGAVKGAALLVVKGIVEQQMALVEPETFPQEFQCVFIGHRQAVNGPMSGSVGAEEKPYGFQFDTVFFVFAGSLVGYSVQYLPSVIRPKYQAYMGVNAATVGKSNSVALDAAAFPEGQIPALKCQPFR